MTQTDRRIYLIKALLAEQPRYRGLSVPADTEEQKSLLRSLMNVRMPQPIGTDFLAVQDEYLREELARRGVTGLADLTPISEGIYLWQGDITTLRCDAIVNAANSALLGCFYPYKTPEEHWAYWSRYIWVNRYTDPPKPVYRQLLQLVKDKDYFVLTTNVDHCFQKAGFDKKRLFYTQGDYGLFQCSEPCCQETFENESIVEAMVQRQRDMRVPAELIPCCPHCGRPLTMNLRSDDRFVEDEGWHTAAERYSQFLHRRKGMTVLFLELGVGYNTPGIIKYPFWQMTAQNPKAMYACLNAGQAACPSEIEKQSVCIDGDIGQALQLLLEDYPVQEAADPVRDVF